MTDGHKAKEALERSDERLRLAKSAAGIGVYDFDVDSRVIEWDARVRELWGVGPNEPVTYERYMSGIHPEDRPAVQAGVLRALDPNGDGQIASQHRVVNPIDGVTRWISATGQVSFVDGKPKRLVGTVSDVTAAKHAEALIKANEERLRLAAEANAKFRTMFEQGPQFAVILSPAGIVLEANRVSLEASGLPREEIVGKPFWECGWWNRSPTLMELIRAAALEAAAGRPFHAESRYFAGARERMLDLVIAPVTDDDGRALFVAATGADITDRKRADERLRLLDALSEATRTASDPSEILAATTRLLGTHLDATRCAYADVEADNDHFAIPHDWTAFGATSTVGSYELHRFGAGVAADLTAGQTIVVRDVDVELGPDGGGAMFNAIGVKAMICCPLVKEGRLVALMAVHQSVPRDWTSDDVALVEQVVDRSWAHIERARAAEALREQDRRKDEFLAILAHELRNPLAPVRTGVHLLKTATGDRAEETRAMMDRQLGHMVRLIDDLFDVSRVSRGNFELRREPIQIQSVIDSALEASRPLIEARRHALTVRVPGAPVWLDGDLTRLAQVVSNLLNNSAKYTPDGGRIELLVEHDAGEIVIRVIDSGAGIAAEMLPRVFDMFAQASRTLGRAHGGLGIGLSLVRRLVEMHGGAIDAASAGVGHGSVFTVRLPANPSLGRDAGPRVSDVVPARAAERRRILVVDDNLDGAEMLAQMLALAGHETRVASDGPSALAAARAFAPDLAFLDIGLPGMDGMELARHFRADESFAGLVLIALTGWGSAEDRRRTKDAGFDFHLTKPVSASEVHGLLARTAG